MVKGKNSIELYGSLIWISLAACAVMMWAHFSTVTSGANSYFQYSAALFLLGALGAFDSMLWRAYGVNNELKRSEEQWIKLYHSLLVWSFAFGVLMGACAFLSLPSGAVN